MAKKREKRISINVLESVMNETYKENETFEWNGIEVSIKKTLGFRDAMAFIDEISSMCFLEDGEFSPGVVDLIIKSGILSYYANFTLPDNVEKRYDLLYRTDAVDFVVGHINTNQLKEIINSADRMIRHLCDSDIMHNRHKINEILNQFNNTNEKFSDIFDGISSEEVVNALAAMGNMNFSEDKATEAYINFMKKGTSDVGDGG